MCMNVCVYGVRHTMCVTQTVVYVCVSLLRSAFFMVVSCVCVCVCVCLCVTTRVCLFLFADTFGYVCVVSVYAAPAADATSAIETGRAAEIDRKTQRVRARVCYCVCVCRCIVLRGCLMYVCVCVCVCVCVSVCVGGGGEWP